MNDRIDIEPILVDWFGDGSDVLPDRSIQAVLATVGRTRQRGAWRTSWRTPTVHPSSRFAALTSAAVLITLVGVAIASWPGEGRPAVTGPTASAPPSAAPATPVAVTPVPVTPAPAASPSGPLGTAPLGTILFKQQGGSGPQGWFRMSPSGADRVQLALEEACCLVASPDDTMVLMAKGDPVAPTLYTIGGSIVEGPWSPVSGLSLAPRAWRGSDVALEGWDDARPRRTGVWLSIGNGGGMLSGDFRQLTTSSAGHHDVPLAFSSDGSRMLFIRTDETYGDLYVVSIDRQALTSPKNPQKPADPIKLNPPGTAVAVDDYFGAGASWSPDGTQVAFAGFDLSSNDNESTVYIVDAGGGPGTAITTPSRWTSSAHWSPDGRWIAFDRDNGTGQHDLHLYATDGGGDTNLTADFAPGVCCARWAPDSRYLLVAGTTSDDAHDDLYVIPIDGSPPTRATQDPAQYSSMDWIE